MVERELQREVGRLCRRLGLSHFHVPDSRRMTPGWVDSVIVGRGVLFRELKDDFDSCSPDQLALGYLLTAAGADYAVWRPRHWRDGTIRGELEDLAW